MNWSRGGENRSGSTLGGIAFSRVRNCTELGEDIDRASRENVDLSLFFGFSREDWCRMKGGLGVGKWLNVSCPSSLEHWYNSETGPRYIGC